MAHTEEMLVHGVMTPVTVFDSSAQEVDDVIGKTKYYSAKNLLDNAYFGNPVNQRGQTEYSGGGQIAIDRWKIINAGKIKVCDGYIRVEDTDWGISQLLDRPSEQQAHTASILIRNLTLPAAGGGMAVCGWLTEEQLAAAQGNEWVLISNAVVPAQNDLLLRFGIETNGNNGWLYSFDLKAVKLELGDQQTLAHKDESGNWVLNEIPNYAEELAKCQRYYEEMDYIALIGAKLDDTLPYKVTKRVNPALQLISANGVSGKISYWNGSAWIDFTGGASYINGKGTYGCRINSLAANTPSEAAGSLVSCRVIVNAEP